MKILFFNDYQLPILNCFFLFISMLLYWINLALPKQELYFSIGRYLVMFSSIIFAFTLGIRWIEESYFPLSNLYESLIFLFFWISIIHLLI